VQVDSRIALHRGGDLADHAAKRARQRCRPELDEADVDAEHAAHRRHLRPGEAAADDHDTARTGGEALAQGRRVGHRVDHEDAVERRLVLLVPRPRAQAGGDQATVVGQLLAALELQRVVDAVEPDGARAQLPVDAVERAELRQDRVVGRREPEQHLLGERRPVVGALGFLADDGDRAGEALGAQRLGPARTGQAAAARRIRSR
jgi:hypothetical protein